jgi:nitroimidazol reductase NimA-like FMN-containing flavoprotein (pyridoxamine 5'-phosphate oxidase superfamily)
VPLTPEDRRFLAEPRLGFLTVAPSGDRWPVPVPVWFEADDDGVQLFTSPGSRKARQVRATPRASLVAANHVGEPEHWVSVTGPARVATDGAHELATRLARRYWDLSDPALAAVLRTFLEVPQIRIVIEAEEVTRYGGG